MGGVGVSQNITRKALTCKYVSWRAQSAVKNINHLPVGHVARSYYSAGRKLEPDTLKRMFSEHVERGKALFASHQPAVEASARTTDVGSLLQMVRR